MQQLSTSGSTGINSSCLCFFYNMHRPRILYRSRKSCDSPSTTLHPGYKYKHMHEQRVIRSKYPAMSFRSSHHHQQPRHHHGGRPDCGSRVEYYRDDRFDCEDDYTTYVTTVEKKTTVNEGPHHFGNKHGAFKHEVVYEEDEILERGKLVERDGYAICKSERAGCEDELDMETEFVSRKRNYVVKAA